MDNILLRIASFVLVPCIFLGCSARPIKSGTVTETRTAPEVAPISEHSVKGPDSEISIEDLRALNTKASKPTFGIIKGFYQLPETFPHGAIALERARSFGFEYESITISRIGTKPFVIMPASADETEAISMSMNQLMDAGIRFVEVSLADATKIIEAEKVAIAKKTWMFPSSSIPSGVDLLLSIERGYGNSGPIYVGRVIRTKDGQLFALSTEPDVGPYSMSPLISRLVKSSLGRLGGQK